MGVTRKSERRGIASSFPLPFFFSSLHFPSFPQLPLRVGNDEVMPATVVRDLGIYIDANVSMRSHVTKTVSGCFAVLRQLRSVRLSVSRSVFQSLAVSLVLSRLDHGNATLSGIPQYLLIGGSSR